MIEYGSLANIGHDQYRSKISNTLWDTDSQEYWVGTNSFSCQSCVSNFILVVDKESDFERIYYRLRPNLGAQVENTFKTVMDHN